MVDIKKFGSYEGAEVKEFAISDGDLCASVLEYGATLHKLVFNGVDCILGYDDLDGYVNGGSHQGATVGRYANRIGNASFCIGNATYNVGKNDNGVNSLHGGDCGFSHRMYKGEKLDKSSVRFTIFSPDGEGGYPGNLTMSVTFSISDNTLCLRYEAVSDKDTVMNFTNHAYFNLGSPDNLTTLLTIKSDAITPVDSLLIPTGELMDVTGTAFDFRSPKTIGRDIGDDCEQIKLGGGYDHNFVLGDSVEYRQDVVTAVCPDSKITMKCSTDLPGVQFYSANMLSEPHGKGGMPLFRNEGFCLETQFWPDSPNKPQFPSCTVASGKKFESVTKYSFEK